jgi:hypothetical protein
LRDTASAPGYLRMNGNTFTPLPGVTGFEAIAW